MLELKVYTTINEYFRTADLKKEKPLLLEAVTKLSLVIHK